MLKGERINLFFHYLVVIGDVDVCTIFGQTYMYKLIALLGKYIFFEDLTLVQKKCRDRYNLLQCCNFCIFSFSFWMNRKGKENENSQLHTYRALWQSTFVTKRKLRFKKNEKFMQEHLKISISCNKTFHFHFLLVCCFSNANRQIELYIFPVQ